MTGGIGACLPAVRMVRRSVVRAPLHLTYCATNMVSAIGRPATRRPALAHTTAWCARTRTRPAGQQTKRSLPMQRAASSSRSPLLAQRTWYYQRSAGQPRVDPRLRTLRFGAPACMCALLASTNGLCQWYGQLQLRGSVFSPRRAAYSVAIISQLEKERKKERM